RKAIRRRRRSTRSTRHPSLRTTTSTATDDFQHPRISPLPHAGEGFALCCTETRRQSARPGARLLRFPCCVFLYRLASGDGPRFARRSGGRGRRECGLGGIGAEIVDDAGLAMRLARDADIAAVQDEPVMRIVLPLLG